MKRLLIVLFGLIIIVMFSTDVYADEYTYDDNGRVIEVVHDDGSVTSYTYDDNGNIIETNTVSSDSSMINDERTTEIEITTEVTTEETSEGTTEEITTEDETNPETDFNKLYNDKQQENNKLDDTIKTTKSNKTGDSIFVIISLCLLLISILVIMIIGLCKRYIWFNNN